MPSICVQVTGDVDIELLYFRNVGDCQDVRVAGVPTSRSAEGPGDMAVTSIAFHVHKVPPSSMALRVVCKINCWCITPQSHLRNLLVKAR